MSESVSRQVERLLRSWRLVTVVGEAGSGKSAVAERTAAALARRFTDGAHVVDLSGLRDPQLLPHTIAAALGVHDRTPVPLPAALAEYVRDRYMLIVLDSCEHMVTACAAVAEYLLMAGRHVQILATSRRPLGTPGERVLALPAPPEPVRAAVARAYEAAPPAERDAWVRLSVFPGTFARPAAEVVCGTPVLPAVAEPVRDGRFRLPKPVREHGEERLAADAARALRTASAEYFCGFAARFDAAWFGPGQALWLGRVRAETPNVRAALRHRLGDPGGARTGAQAALDLRHAWLAGGTLAEGRYWLDRAGALTGDPRLALASGRLAVAQRAIPQAVSLLEPARDAFVTARDPGGYARSLCALGAAALATDDHADALRLLDDGVARTETTLDTDACLARIDLAEVLLALGDADRADALCRDVVAACEQRGEQWVRGSALLGAARSALVRGDLPAMRACATDALRAQRAVGAVPGASVSLTMLALLAAADGQFERAAVLHGAAYRARSASGLVGVGPSPADPDGEELRGAVRIVREELGDRPYQEAFRHGAALRTDQAAAYALREPDAEQAPETGSAA